MQIQLPDELAEELRVRAAGAGLGSIEEYVLQLVEADRPSHPELKHPSLERIRRLRESVDKMSADEIVQSIHESRPR